jgi:hypothetical protein
MFTLAHRNERSSRFGTAVQVLPEYAQGVVGDAVDLAQ